jgi:hypothetical protein
VRKKLRREEKIKRERRKGGNEERERGKDKRRNKERRKARSTTNVCNHSASSLYTVLPSVSIPPHSDV